MENLSFGDNGNIPLVICDNKYHDNGGNGLDLTIFATPISTNKQK